MSKRHLPGAAASTRPGVRTRVTPSAFEHWNPFLRSAASESEDLGVISILDVIGADFFGEGVTARSISAALRAIGPRPVRVDINSPGGDFFEGLAIYNLLREHPETVTVHVLGLAASAASIIAMAGDTVRVPRAGFLMIHNAWVIAMGNRNELREVSDWLAPFDAASADIYAARSGIDAAEVAKMMDRETWLGGAAAVEKGFADDFLPADQAAEDRDDEDAKNRAALLDLRKLNEALARSGMPRTERRELFKSLGALRDAGPSGGTPGAAPTGTLSAADVAGIRGVLDLARTIRIER